MVSRKKRKQSLCNLICNLIISSICWKQDFAYYKSGVYKHITGAAMGGHAVKLIGWGTTDEGEDYWVCKMCS